MAINIKLGLQVATTLLVALSASYAAPVTQTYTGSLASTTSVVQEPITVDAPSSFTAYTTSYATGGFQPSLSLFDSTGKFVAAQQSFPTNTQTDPNTGLALDSYLFSSNVTPGAYTLTLTNWLYQLDPSATNLSGGFINYGGSDFADQQGNARSSNYALTVTTDSAAAATPEPATAWFVLPVLAGAFLVARKRQSATASKA